MDTVTFETLPVEVLEIVLCSAEITPLDIVNFSKTCKTFSCVYKKSSLWKRKFKQYYPTLFLNKSTSKNWRLDFIAVFKLQKELNNHILALSQIFIWSMYHDYEWPDIPRRALALYENLYEEVVGEGLSKFYVIDECFNIIQSLQKHKNLTLKYYAEKIYCHLYDTYILDPMWKTFLSLPSVNSIQKFEEGASCISRCLQRTSDTTVKNIKYNLDSLSWKILKTIKQKHSYLSHISSDLCNTFNESLWDLDICEIILYEIHTYIWHTKNFKIDASFDYNPCNYCIDYTISSFQGNYKILKVIEICIARRLGVYCELYSSDSDSHTYPWTTAILCKGKKSYERDCNACMNKPVLINYTKSKRIDAVLFCQSLLQQLILLVELKLRGEWWEAVEPVVYNLLDEDIYQHSIRTLFSSWRHVEHWKISQLRHFISQLQKVSNSEMSSEGRLLHLNILLRINSKLTLDVLSSFRRNMVQQPSTFHDLLRMVASVNIRAKARVTDLKNLLSGSSYYYFENRDTTNSVGLISYVPWSHGWPGGEIVQKRRVDRKSWQVQFAVGQVLEHRVGTLCVVYDWDSMCVESEETLVVMGEDILLHGTDQPFYRVLLNNGAARYTAQENLRHAKNPEPVNNVLLGRYFTAFVFPHYIPNPQKAYEYPEDANVREQDALACNLL